MIALNFIAQINLCLSKLDIFKMNLPFLFIIFLLIILNTNYLYPMNSTYNDNDEPPLVTKFYVYVGGGIANINNSKFLIQDLKQGPAILTSFEIEPPLELKISLELAIHSWVARGKQQRDYYPPYDRFYYSFGNDYVGQTGISLLFKYNMFEIDEKVGLKVGLGWLFLSLNNKSNRYNSTEAIISLYYNVDKNHSIFINYRDYIRSGGGESWLNESVVPSTLSLSLRYNL